MRATLATRAEWSGNMGSGVHRVDMAIWAARTAIAARHRLPTRRCPSVYPLHPFRDSHALSRFQAALPPWAFSCGLACTSLACACAFARVLAPCSPCIALVVLGCQELFFALLCLLLLGLPWVLSLPSCCFIPAGLRSAASFPEIVTSFSPWNCTSPRVL